MSTLHHLYDTRAARAADDADPETVLATVRGRVERRTRRRRHAAAAGTGIAGVTALIVGLAVLAPGDDDADHRPDAPAGGGSSAATSLPSAATPNLMPIDPAPASAEVSVALVPAGWVLLSTQGPNTLYGPVRLRDSSPDDVLGKLLVSVHERIGTPQPQPLTIAGHPGSYDVSDDNDPYQGVDIILDATTEVNIQLPVSAGLSRDDVLRLADTLDVRRTTEKTHG